MRGYNQSLVNEKYKFSEKEQDIETGFSYFGARYYDGTLGIWHQTDPLSFLHPDMSPYNYCLNNPLLFRDPFGLDTVYYSKLNDVVVNANESLEIQNKSETPGLSGTTYISDERQDSYSETQGDGNFVPLGILGLSPMHSRVSAKVNVFSQRGMSNIFLKVVVVGKVPLQDVVLFTTWMGTYYLYQNGVLLQSNGLNVPSLDHYTTSDVTADATIMLPNSDGFDLKIQIDCTLHTETGNAVSRPLNYDFHVPALRPINP